jgi:hypothetical protein
LELPLFQEGAGEACCAAEDEGFYFSGVGPAFGGGGDALLLQLPREDIDLSVLQINHPFAIELLEYVSSERERVEKSVAGR